MLNEVTSPKTNAAHSPWAFTLRDASRMCGLSEDTLRRRAKEGKLRLIRVVGRTLVDGDSLRALLGKAAA